MNVIRSKASEAKHNVSKRQQNFVCRLGCNIARVAGKRWKQVASCRSSLRSKGRPLSNSGLFRLSLDGFALSVAADGRFLYISETVSIYLGLSQEHRDSAAAAHAHYAPLLCSRDPTKLTPAYNYPHFHRHFYCHCQI
ncbi:hypothetical protein MSG28_011976 [Choristoneura fumiferana]|uniref:Uncharacterized protein n=1 Tax=Choristoneura fumiferana TaxID=7141 RepID=A0ACC0KNC7_CHOFU|nr:hypothetical protein MSG28_011976 [Choristoneura fumiferana]